MRSVLLVVLVGLGVCAGCSCEDTPELVAEGYVRCHLAPAPDGERRHGALRLRFEGRVLTIDGLPEVTRLAVGTGPTGDAPVPDAVDLVILLGDMVGQPVPETDALVILLAGGADEWSAWSEGVGRIDADWTGIVDATPLRRIIAGSFELVPVAGGPSRHVRTDACCGLASADAEQWSFDGPSDGPPRVLLSWAAPEARGLLGGSVQTPAVQVIRANGGLNDLIFAWPRLDPRSVKPVGGAWVTRFDGSRESPGWTLYEVGEHGLRSVPARLDSGEGPD